MPSALDSKNMQVTMTDTEYRRIRDLARRFSGIKMSEDKRDLLMNRLARRLRECDVRTYTQYCDVLESNDSEVEQFTNAITTNLTSFFREQHHFDFLKQKLIPELLTRKHTDRVIRVWSAGCSTGEEPYSLAMTFREAVPEHAGYDVRILATDLDSDALARAKSGVYSNERIEGLSSEQRKRWFLRGKGANNGLVRVKPDLAQSISFRQLNLHGPWPFKGPIDIIFCRNVVIYFDKPTQKELFKRYAETLSPNGHLFIGHSESLFNVSNDFELLGNTIYRLNP